MRNSSLVPVFAALSLLSAVPAIAQGLSNPPGLAPAGPGQLAAAPYGVPAQPPRLDPTDPASYPSMGYRNPFGLIPRANLEMLNGTSTTRIGAGVILTGIMEQTISSNNSKAGEIFSIRLEDGYFVDNKEVVPKGSRIIGSVVSASAARTMKGGHAGQIQIALQTLVFPDGRTTHFTGYIEHNPTQDLKQKSGSQLPNVSQPVKQTMNGLLGFVSRYAGMGRMTVPTWGPEMKIEKGLAVPIKTSSGVDLSHMTPATNAIQTAQTPSVQPTPGSPMYQGPAAPINSVSQSPAVAPQRSFAQPSQAPAAAPDPNSIFSGPLMPQQAHTDMPEPF